ncbi:MAG TPA: hypothetical protein VGM30_14950 [Puia sp.]|jgi:hypothetical protein
MSKKAIALQKALERSEKIAKEQYEAIEFVLEQMPGIDRDGCGQHLEYLSEYLKANRKMQMAIDGGYGDTPRAIANKAVKNNSLIKN